MPLPEKICILPWISIETSPIGTARPCCLAKDEITYHDELGVEQKYNLKTHTLEEKYNSQYMQLLRRDFLYGQKPETCQRCWEEEAAGRVSKRINSRVRLKEYYDQINFQVVNGHKKKLIMKSKNGKMFQFTIRKNILLINFLKMVGGLENHRHSGII